jgi:hypothetical protein
MAGHSHRPDDGRQDKSSDNTQMTMAAKHKTTPIQKVIE